MEQGNVTTSAPQLDDDETGITVMFVENADSPIGWYWCESDCPEEGYHWGGSSPRMAEEAAREALRDSYLVFTRVAPPSVRNLLTRCADMLREAERSAPQVADLRASCERLARS